MLRELGWWVADYVYAAVWQARGILNTTDPATFHSGDRTPIVVIPGIWESWTFMQPLITSMHERGHPVHVVPLLRFNGRPVADAAAHVDAYIDEAGLDDVLLVTHSKGGLIGKYVMVNGSSAMRIRGMVAVAAPFAGSAYAPFLVLPSLRVFSPKNAVILGLTRELALNDRIVSVFGRFDPHIPGGSELAGAKNVRLETGGHFRVLANPRVIAEVVLSAE
ncbi:pimeloyl-ACP methyl ester carboxylesterase [Conyzicola lurida]|uniref:Pimeloyl-ACP methyl ester carboxylesterase n=1 Tax=Conyzicola lurida TaxID=1172621 RepID=A0A841AQZ5_9MICO|nr:alpha/beta hydrolase [Conyzicola lurida]MBB5844362.1 pimeloyl-ACP methyl ester carboxylesterase [Conyzicola lurida]